MTKAREQEKHIKFLHEKFGNLKIIELPLFPHELVGLELLKEAERMPFQSVSQSKQIS